MIKRFVLTLMTLLPLSGLTQTLNLHLLQQGKPIADVAVTLTALNKTENRSKNAAIIDQVNREFTPYVSVIQTGTAVRFPNRDNIRHHVYSFSPAKPFELKLYSGTPSQPVVFDKPGVVVLGCNIHDWMLAYVWIVDTPYFGVSDQNGMITIEQLPAEKFTLQIWHPDQKQALADSVIDLTDTAALQRDIEINVNARTKKSGRENYP